MKPLYDLGIKILIVEPRFEEQQCQRKYPKFIEPKGDAYLNSQNTENFLAVMSTMSIVKVRPTHMKLDEIGTTTNV